MDDYDPDDTRALFQRVVDDITEQIADGRLAAGDRVPSANQLRETYGISTMTAQRALQDLKTLGLTHAMPGKGTFVRPDAQARLQHPAPEEDFAVGLTHTKDPDLNKRVDAFNAELLRITATYAADYDPATGDPEEEERAWEQVQDRLRGEFATHHDLLLAVAQQQAAEDKQLQRLLRNAQTAAQRRTQQPAKKTTAKRAPRRRPT